MLKNAFYYFISENGNWYKVALLQKINLLNENKNVEKCNINIHHPKIDMFLIREK